MENWSSKILDKNLVISDNGNFEINRIINMIEQRLLGPINKS